MKIYITGIKSSGKSFIIDYLKERYDNSNLQKIFIEDFDKYCYYDNGEYINPAVLLTEFYKTYDHVIISGSRVKNMIDLVDKIYFIDINYGTWIAQLKNRLENGRVNSKFSKISDVELSKYSPKQFNDYKKEKIDYYKDFTNFELISLSNLSTLITKYIDKVYKK